MGIGRREFLRSLGGAFAALAAGPSSAVTIVGDQYVNRKLGIAFTKPLAWHFANVREMGEVKAGQILDLDDAVLARELIDSTDLPILTASKEPLSSSSNRFTPAVNIYLENIDELDALLVDDAHADIAFCSSILKDFQVTLQPMATRVSECDGLDYTASFVFEHEKMMPTPVRMRTLLVFQRPVIYSMRMYDSPCSGPEMTFDFSPFVKSLKLA